MFKYDDFMQNIYLLLFILQFILRALLSDFLAIIPRFTSWYSIKKYLINILYSN